MSQVVRRKLYFVAALVPGKWRPRNPRVVDEDMERPVRFQKRIGKAVDGARAGEIERDHFRVPDFFEISPGFFDIAGADDGRPRFRENARGLQANTGVAAGYNCNLSPKVAAAKRILPGRLRSESRSKGLSVRSSLVCSFLDAFTVGANPDGLYLLRPKRYESSGY
jgi:hypothetical protein